LELDFSQIAMLLFGQTATHKPQPLHFSVSIIILPAMFRIYRSASRRKIFQPSTLMRNSNTKAIHCKAKKRPHSLSFDADQGGETSIILSECPRSAVVTAFLKKKLSYRLFRFFDVKNAVLNVEPEDLPGFYGVPENNFTPNFMQPRQRA
jgi:hypothetical protein